MTYVPAVGVVDRTGRLLPVVRAALAHLEPVDVLDMGRADALVEATPDVDVLVVGPRDLTSAGLRHVVAWRAGTDGAAVVACPRGAAPAGLAAAGVHAVVAGDPPAAARLSDVLEELLDRSAPAPAPVRARALAELGLGDHGVVDEDDDGDLDAVLAVRDRWEDERASATGTRGGGGRSGDDDEPRLVAARGGGAVSDGRGVVVGLDDDADAWDDDWSATDEPGGGAAGEPSREARQPHDDPDGDELDVPVAVPQRRARPRPSAAPAAPLPPRRELGAVASTAASAVGAPATAAASADRPLDGPQPGAGGTVLVVLSPTGGSGKTLVATNAAAHLAAAGRRALLVDLDLQLGQVGAALRVQHERSLYDGLYGADGRPLARDVLDAHLDELVHAHELGFDVLTAPRDPALARGVTPADAEHLLAVARARYEAVVVDTAPAVDDVALAAAAAADVVCVLATLDVPSLRSVTRALDALRDAGVDEGVVRLVLNKVEADLGVDVTQAQDAFGGRFVGELPASRSASRSINAGTVVLRAEPRSDLARALVRVLEAVLPEDALPRGAAAQRQPARWPRLRGARRS